uniref:Uncharacterized protein n=1 Tax=Rhizophora mucronata TaxID=61149 RepID=A0A2P2MQG7_RHIMU
MQFCALKQQDLIC